MANLDETAVFLVHAVKQFCFGFETMNEVSDSVEAGSPLQAFYMNAIYHYVATFYLIDGEGKPMGGAFYPALKQHGLERLLDPVRQVLGTPLGETTFGEVVRVFRNKVLVHTQYGDADLRRIYAAADMEDPAVQARFRDGLFRVYIETKLLRVRVAEATGRPLADFGIREKGR